MERPAQAKMHLLTIKQGLDESVGEYVVRFNNEALQVEGYTDGATLIAIASGLQDKRLI